MVGMCMRYWQIYQNGQVRVDAQKEQLFSFLRLLCYINNTYFTSYLNLYMLTTRQMSSH